MHTRSPTALAGIVFSLLCEFSLAGPSPIDPTFGTFGIVTVPGIAVTALATQDDGKVVAAGLTRTTPRRLAVVRYTSSGVLDPAFGYGGIAIAATGTGDTVATALVLQPNGKILAAGYAYGVPDDPSFNARVVLVRYDTNGNLDRAFGIAGTVTTSILPRSPNHTETLIVGGLALQPDGKVAVGGVALSAAGTDTSFIVRYNDDGSLDGSFGAAGVARTTPGDRTYLYVTFGPLVQSDGRLVMFGQTRPSSGDSRLAAVRYLSDGRLDVAFGTGGLADVPFLVTDARQQADARILVAAEQSGPPTLRLSRLHIDGALDASFGTNGAADTPFGECRPPVSSRIDPCPRSRTAIALQPDGRILQSGIGIDVLDNVTAMVRYLPSGLPDTTFGNGGRIAGRPAVGGQALAIERDGARMYVGGSDYYSDAKIARYVLVTTPGAITLASSANPVAAGESVTLTGTIAGQSPAGTVSFSDNGSPLPGCQGIPLVPTTQSLAIASCSTVLAVGIHSVVAAYSGDNSNSPNTSAELIQRVGEPPGTQVIEYFNADFGAYFMSADANEIAKLDSAATAGWARTGQVFFAFPAGTAQTQPMCRFYSGIAYAPKYAHFFAASRDECAIVRNPPWIYEGHVIPVALPTVAGGCANGSTPLYRLYNNSGDGVPHHRYTTSAAIRTLMLAQGWIAEGTGIGVTACVPF